MPVSALASNICNALKGATPGDSQYSSGAPAQCNSIIAQQITTYILANAQVITAYVGVIPGTPPVPEAGAGTHKVAGSVAPPGTASSYASWVDELAANICKGFNTLPAVVIPKGTHVSFQVPVQKISVFCPQASLKGAHQGNTKDPQLDVWTKICDGLFQMINTQVSPSFPAGIAGTGVATVTKLVLT